MRGLSGALILAGLLAGCGRKAESKASPSTATATATATATPTATPTPTPTTTTTPTTTADAATSSDSSAPASAFDAGVNGCRLAYGPLQQAWTGAAALVPTDGALELVTNKNGVPAVTRMTLPPSSGPRIGRVALETEAVRVSSSPCAVAGSYFFCMDALGAITRTTRGEATGKVVGRGRPGTRIAAATVGGTHAVVMYLVERRKDDGTLLEAYASVDDAPPVRLSEDGSGATSVALAPRGHGAVALLLDGRSAMTPVHARAIAWRDGLDVGVDAVVFVGGGAEQHTSCALGTSSSGAALALVPTASEAGFGMAAVHLGDPPAIDEKTVWSMYPNGLDPAPIAATTGASPIRVARVRPVEARHDSPRGVELGKLDESGAFTPYGMISTTGRASDLAVATDSAGALWVYYTDSAGTWLERRVCP